LPDPPNPPDAVPPSPEPPGAPQGEPPPSVSEAGPVPPARKKRGFGAFSGGCLLTCVAGAALALLIMTLNKSGNPTGCVFIQLLYVIPVVAWLFRTGRKAWALGVIFGGAVVLLLGSICADMARTGFH
jgi:hypothetical protein